MYKIQFWQNNKKSVTYSWNIQDFREIVGIALNRSSVESKTLNGVTVGAKDAFSFSLSPIK